MPRLRSLTLGGLLLSLTACQALPPGGLFSFSLDAASPAVPVVTAGDVARPGPAASTSSGNAPATPAQSGTAAGGGASGTARAAGVVTDASGRPLAGVTIAGGGATATSDAAGAFAIAAGGPLTASLDGYGSQTLPSPYHFALSPLGHAPDAAYTLVGTTQPPVAGARVLFVDAAGTSAAGLTEPDGTFHVDVEPRSAADTPALLAVMAELALPLEPRFGVLDATTPRCGAMRLAHPNAGSAAVVMTTATGTLSLAPAPAPLAVSETTLQLVDESGLALPLGSVEGPFPASVPTFAVPGLHAVVSLRSSGDDGDATVERADPAAGETWRPTWLDRPNAFVGDGTLHVEANGPVALSMRPESLAVPTWQAIAAPGSVALPPRGEGTTILEVRAFDGAPATFAGMFAGATADRRSATSRLALLGAPAPLE